MTPDLSLSLSLATPELIVALGAMALLMVGVYSGERANTTVTGLSVALLIAVAAWIALLRRRRSGLRQRLHLRWLRAFHEGADAGRLRCHAHHVGRFRQGGKIRQVRISRPHHAFDARHDADDLGELYDRALSRPRAAIAGPLRRRGDQPRQRALYRGWPQIFRAWRAVVRHAALRHQPRLWLHRKYRFPGDCGSARRRRAAAWPCLRPCLRAGWPCLQDLGRAVPYVDAGRL
jgi:hypothetical protein